MELRYPDGEIYIPTTKDLVNDVPAGTIYYQEAGGGAGCGNPKERPVEQVVSDVRNEKVSAEVARNEYGVAVDPVTFKVDETETAKLRG